MLQIAALFPEPVINFCGDELRYECLDSNPKIKGASRAKRAGTSLCTRKTFTKSRSIFSRSTENGPAFP